MAFNVAADQVQQVDAAQSLQAPRMLTRCLAVGGLAAALAAVPLLVIVAMVVLVGRFGVPIDLGPAVAISQVAFANPAGDVRVRAPTDSYILENGTTLRRVNTEPPLCG